MVNNQCESNVAIISGKIISDLIFNHVVYGEEFYYFMVEVRRLSSSADIIPVMVSDRLLDCSEYKIGRYIEVTGQFRSYNSTTQDGTTKLMLTIFARDINFPAEPEDKQDKNWIELDGYICKKPVYRTTPFNREITDILLAVNRSFNKSDYIPCISWGRNARYCGRRNVGDNVRVSGRVQSRVYQKKLPDGNISERTAYEISVAKLELKSPVEERQEKPDQPETTDQSNA